jgi:release factor glutamine methyltransferase
MKTTIAELQKKYFQKIDHLDLDLIMAHIIKKPREFVMAHPEHRFTGAQIAKIETFIQRRVMHEPLAYILGHKEFFGLNFKVTPDTLIPRPETELLVELAMQETLNQKQKTNILDIGTGSGNIIISLAKNLVIDLFFFGIDISAEALKTAKQNARINEVSEKIKFIHGSLLDKIKNINNSVIIANLPYLSQEVYAATLPNVKNFEPKSALYSPKEGLSHYGKLLKQIAKFDSKNCTIFLEISPEQKTKLPKIIKTFLPQAKIEFKKDLSKKWRVCRIEI